MKGGPIITDTLIYNDRGFWDSDLNEDISYTKNGHEIILSFEDESFWYNHRNEVIMTVVNNYKPDQILDIGGGNGFVSLMLQKLVKETIMIEPELEGVLNAINRGVREVYRGSLKSVRIEDSSCKAVGLFDVIEHIEDDTDFLKLVNSKIESNGILFITVPAYQNLWSTFDLAVGHYRRYNLKELTTLMGQSGFEVVYSSYFFAPTLIPFYLSRKWHNGANKQKQRKKEHLSVDSALVKMLKPFFELEVAMIKKKKSLPFGSSCLMVARKL